MSQFGMLLVEVLPSWKGFYGLWYFNGTTTVETTIGSPPICERSESPPGPGPLPRQGPLLWRA